MEQTTFPGHEPVGVDAATQARILASHSTAKPTAPELGARTRQPELDKQRRKHHLEGADLSEIASILKRAEDGDTEGLADLWLHMLKTDAHLRSVWDTLVGPVASANWELAPAPDVPAAEQEAAERAAQGCEEAMRAVDIEEQMLADLNATGLGYAVSEVFWTRGTILGRGAWVPRVEPIHGRRFAFSNDYEIGLYDNGRAVTDLRDDGWDVEELNGRGRRMARLPAGKYIVHQPREISDYPTSTGLVFSLARWWWAKQVTAQYGLSSAETFANPRVVGYLSQFADETVVEEMLEGLETLAADGTMLARGESRVEVLDSKGEGAARTWDMLWRRLDDAMSKLVLGSTLNVEIGESGGNRAAAESQADQTIAPRQERAAAQVWRTWRRDLLTYIVRFNPEIFGQRCPVPVGRSNLAEDPVEVDELVVSTGYVTVDQVLESRGLPPIGGEIGDSYVKPPAVPRAFSDAPREVAAPDPFAASRRPWDEAESLAWALTSRDASATSGRSATSSKTLPSAPSADPQN